jgi:CHAT domain-containing protein
MRKLIIILFVLVSQIIFAQTQKLSKDDKKVAADKMLARVKKTKADTIYVDSLISVGKQFINTDVSFSMNLLKTAINLSDSLYGQTSSRHLESLHQLAVVHSGTNNLEESLEINKKTLELRSNILPENHIDVLRSKNNLALNYLSLSEFEIFRNLMWEVISSLKISKKYNPVFYRSAFHNLSNHYFSLRNFDTSLQLLNDLMTIQIINDDFEGVAMTLQTMSAKYSQLEDYKNAYSSIIKSLELSEQHKIKNNELKTIQLKSLIFSMFNLNMFDEVESPLKNLEELSKKSWDDQVWAKYYIVLYYGIKDHSKYFEKELKNLVNLYKGKYPNEIDALGELYWRLSNSLGNYQADNYALRTSEKLFDLYKELVTKDIRFFNSGFALGTSLQNLERFEEAIKIFEDVKQKSNLTFDQNENYFLLLGNLARCFKTIGNIEMSVSTRKEAVEAFKNIQFNYLKNEKSELDKLLEEQTSELLSLSKIEDLEKFYKDIIEFYSVKHDTLSQVEYLIKLSKIFSEKLYDPDKAKFYIDETELLISDENEITIQNGILNHAKGNFYRLQNKFSSNFINFYENAYDILKILGYIGSGNFEFENAAYYISLNQIKLNNVENAKEISNGLTLLLCNKFGQESLRCIEAQLNHLDLFKDHLVQDSLLMKIHEIESKNGSIQDNTDLKLKLNSLKYHLEKDGSIEQKKLIEENILLIRKSWNNDPKSVLIKTQKLAEWYFVNDSIEKGLDVWKIILKSVDSLNSADLHFTMYTLYASDLILRNINVDLGIKILSEDLKIEEKKIFDSYDYLIFGLRLKGQFKHALKLIEEKENFLIENFSETSDEFLNFGDSRLQLYRTQGDYLNLIKWGEKFLNICEQLYPENLSKQINYIYPLCSGYASLQNSERVIELTDRKIKQFSLDLSQIDTQQLSMDQINNSFILNFLNTLSALQYSIYNGKSNVDEIKAIIEPLKELKTISKYLDIESMDPTIDIMLVSLKATIEDSISEDDLNLFKESFDFLVKSETKESSELLYRVLNTTDLIDSIIHRYNVVLPSNYYARIGDFKKADSLALLDIKTEISKMKKYKFALSEEQQLFSKIVTSNNLNYALLSFVEQIHFNDSSADFKLTSNIESNHRTTEISGIDIYELLLNSTGSMLQNRKQLNEVLKQRTDLQLLNNTWVNLQNEINDELITAARKSQLKDSIMLVEQSLFQELGAPEYKWLTFDELKSKLNLDEVLIHSVRLNGLNQEKSLDQDSIIYLHFLIYGDERNIRIIASKMSLEQENEFSENYMYYTSGKGRSISDPMSYLSLFPFLNEIKEGKKIFFVPDGLYHAINPSTIFSTKTESYLVTSNQIEIVNYPSKLLNHRENSIIPRSAVLLGSPDFNINVSIVDKSQFNSPASSNSIPFNGTSRDGFKINPLPNTKKEVDRINHILETHDLETVCYYSEKATEENLKSSISPGILHIATHGYFLEDVPFESSTDNYLGMNQTRLKEDPMLRSGLLLAGASTAVELGDISPNNGVFSAYEASLLDLSNTELVVLSACETGRGEIKNSEGVYGLRKAFADAGAKNVIMSLWKVDDKVTQEFMTLFYEIWLNQKTTIREAFDKTQREIMAKYPQPYYWGAFILVEN